MATFTESFNKANSTTLGPDLTWTEVLGDAEVFSNKWRNVTGQTTEVITRAQHDVGSADMYAQAVVDYSTSGPNWGVCARFSSSAQTFYMICGTSDSASGASIIKCVAGTFTVLGSWQTYTTATDTPYTYRIECSGSTITAKVNGVEVYNQTDTSITTGQRGGLLSYAVTTAVRFDSFETGPLSGAPANAAAELASVSVISRQPTVNVAGPPGTANAERALATVTSFQATGGLDVTVDLWELFQSLYVSAATLIWVDASAGNDANPGTTLSPKRTLQAAVNAASAGTRIMLRSGNYDGASFSGKNGTNSNWIQVVGETGAHVFGSGSGYGALSFQGCSFIAVYGLEITGINTVAVQYELGAYLDGSGHSVAVFNCYIHDFAGHAFAANNGSRFDVCYNRMHNLANWNETQASAISCIGMPNVGNPWSDGYHNRIIGNVIDATWTDPSRHPTSYSVDPSLVPTDGNAIILDRSGSYNGRTLVAHNLVVGCGGKGIHTLEVHHVDAWLNTSVDNSQNLAGSWIGELSIFQATDCHFAWNVVCARPGNEFFGTFYLPGTSTWSDAVVLRGAGGSGPTGPLVTEFNNVDKRSTGPAGYFQDYQAGTYQQISIDNIAGFRPVAAVASFFTPPTNVRNAVSPWPDALGYARPLTGDWAYGAFEPTAGTSEPPPPPDPPPPAGTVNVEAESGTVGGGAAIIPYSGYPGFGGYSATGYVGFFGNTGDFNQVSATVTNTAVHRFRIHYGNATGGAASCLVNVFASGVQVATVTLPNTAASWSDTTRFEFSDPVDFSLTAGANTIRIEHTGAGFTYADLDYYSFEELDAAAPPAGSVQVDAGAATVSPTAYSPSITGTGAINPAYLGSAIVEFGFGYRPINGPTVQWTDVSSYVMGISTRRGRSSEFEQFSPGTASIILVNDDRRFDPSNLTGPYYGQLLPNTPFRVRARIDGTFYAVFYGYTNGFEVSFDAEGGGALSTTTVDCVDGFKLLATKRLPASATVGNTVEGSGVRVGAILDHVNWPAALRSVDTGTAPLAAVALTGTGTTLEYLQKIAETESGRLFVSKDGKVTFHGRNRFLSAATETISQFNFGVDLMPTTSITFVLDDRFIFNEVDATREGGTLQTATDTLSVDQYGPSGKSFTGLLFATDEHAMNLAEYTVYRYKEPVVRSDGFTVDPETDPSQWAAVLGLEIGDRVTLTGVLSSVVPLHLETIEHDITPSEWLISFTGSPLDPNANRFLIFDSVVASERWDAGVFL